jgi:hypothetical protein
MGTLYTVYACVQANVNVNVHVHVVKGRGIGTGMGVRASHLPPPRGSLPWIAVVLACLHVTVQVIKAMRMGLYRGEHTSHLPPPRGFISIRFGLVCGGPLPSAQPRRRLRHGVVFLLE